MKNPKRIIDPALPTIDGKGYDNGVFCVFWQAPYVYTASSAHGMHVVDARDPANPKVIKQLRFPVRVRGPRPGGGYRGENPLGSQDTGRQRLQGPATSQWRNLDLDGLWQNHGAGHGDEGIQLLEFDSTGALTSVFRQDPARFSSLHGFLVLDGLNPAQLHDERAGIQVPAQATAIRPPMGGRSGISGHRREGFPTGFFQGKRKAFSGKWVLGRSG